MTPIHQERLKGLLEVMVRRHTRQGLSNHPVGQLIADEARCLRGESRAPDIANGDANRQLVERLYRRFLLPSHSTVETASEIDSVIQDEIRT